MPSTYDIGDVVRVSVTFTDTGSSPADPSKVHFHYENPAGTVTTASRVSTSTGASNGIVKTDTGDYYYDITTTGQGLYETRFYSTGAVQTAVESWFSVRPLRVST